MDVEPPVTIGKKRRAFSIIVVFSFLFVGTLIALAILVGPYLYAPLESLFFGTAAALQTPMNSTTEIMSG